MVSLEWQKIHLEMIFLITPYLRKLEKNELVFVHMLSTPSGYESYVPSKPTPPNYKSDLTFDEKGFIKK